MTRLTLAFGIMAAVATAFGSRGMTSTRALARRLGQPDAHIEEVVADLLAAGLLRQVDDPAHDLVPAAPLDQIDPAEIVGLVFGELGPNLAGHPLAEAALAAARQAVAGKGFPAPAGNGGEAFSF